MAQRSRTIGRALALVLWCAPSLQAQEPVPLAEGDRILVLTSDAPCRRRWRACPILASTRGTFVRANTDSLYLRLRPTESIVLLRHPDQQVFVSARKSRVRSAVQGALTNGAIAYMLTTVTDASRRSKVGVTLGMTVGGSILGALMPNERWRRASLP